MIAPMIEVQPITCRIKPQVKLDLAPLCCLILRLCAHSQNYWDGR